jgi:hypothetical protein
MIVPDRFWTSAFCVVFVIITKGERNDGRGKSKRSPLAIFDCLGGPAYHPHLQCVMIPISQQPIVEIRVVMTKTEQNLMARFC